MIFKLLIQDFQDVIHVGEKVQLKEEAPASSVPGGKYDLNLVARNEKAKVRRKLLKTSLFS